MLERDDLELQRAIISTMGFPGKEAAIGLVESEPPAEPAKYSGPRPRK